MRRLDEYGTNEVPERRANPLRKFGKKFWDVTLWMLELVSRWSSPLEKTHLLHRGPPHIQRNRRRARSATPANAKLLEGHLDVDRSALTGESLTVERNTGDILYSAPR